MNEWFKMPCEIGWHWVWQFNRMRMVNVWKYDKPDDERMFTNEDGAASIDDDIYNGALWSGPITTPPPPESEE